MFGGDIQLIWQNPFCVNLVVNTRHAVAIVELEKEVA